ncbi:MAG: phosphoribulokinase [Actinomycetota bacterium]|nr:phosphoribulokinase [Actinomycetota bacterium]MDQ3573520.1 phosphoribulokinase [Actinomycetota bacterium]
MSDTEMTIERPGRNNGEGDRPVMLAICGDSATGKTTISDGLVGALGPERITAACVDDYHRYDRNERKALPFTPLNPQCNYMDIMSQHLKLLAAGEPILKPVYSHSDGSLSRPELVEPRDFVIIDGLLPLYTKALRSSFDVTVFLDPPEEIRYEWKYKRDTSQRGYTKDEVAADLKKREPESKKFIHPQRANADIVVRFAPIEERGETPEDPLSATLLLRPTISHPDLSGIVTEDVREAMHLKLTRDDDGKPVDALHIHSYAPRELTRQVEEAIWSELGVDEPLPDTLGMIDGERDEPLAITQLILLYHLIQAKNGS